MDDGICKPTIHVADGIYDENAFEHLDKFIPPGLGRVCILKPLIPEFRVPLPEGSCINVKSACGIFVLWPRRLISVTSKGEGQPKNMYNPPLVRKRKSTITITPQQQAVVDPNLLPPNVVEPKMVEPKVVDPSKMPGLLKALFQKISNH